MTEPGLQRVVALSFLLHIVFFTLAVLLVERTSSLAPHVYTVSLVTPEKAPRPAPHRAAEPERSPRKEPPPRPEKPPPESVKKQPPAAPEAASAQEKKRLMQEKAERLAALKEKHYAEERVQDLRSIKEAEKLKAERLQALTEKLSRDKEKRERLRSLASAKGAMAEDSLSQAQRSSLLDAYTARIQERINELWVYPDIKDLMSLSAEIFVTVSPTGKIKINGFEKASGNRLFDGSALRAIEKAGSVEPPPMGKEMQIMLRFYPRENS
ncbi:MAG: cell envelope integrity protein TolA [Nitrospirota bacterium]|jgi:colicin import membrane protein